MLPCQNPCPHQSPQTVQQPLLQSWTYGTLDFLTSTFLSKLEIAIFLAASELFYKVTYKLREGDTAVFDNLRIMHGRLDLYFLYLY